MQTTRKKEKKRKKMIVLYFRFLEYVRLVLCTELGNEFKLPVLLLADLYYVIQIENIINFKWKSANIWFWYLGLRLKVFECYLNIVDKRR